MNRALSRSGRRIHATSRCGGAHGHRIRMSQQTTIRKLAELVNTPVEKLLEQLAGAGAVQRSRPGRDQYRESEAPGLPSSFFKQAGPGRDGSVCKEDHAQPPETAGSDGQFRSQQDDRECRGAPEAYRSGWCSRHDAGRRARDILRKLEVACNLAEQQALAEKIVCATKPSSVPARKSARQRRGREEGRRGSCGCRQATETLAASKRQAIDETAPRPPRARRQPRLRRSAPPPRNDDRNNRSAPRNERGPGDRFAGQMHLSAADRAPWQQQQQQHPWSSGRPQPGRWPSRHVAVATTPARTRSNVRPHRWCVKWRSATPLPWPTWRRSLR